ncbi:hypothetical protein Btru_005189 [Bulinus truncatus]|nr:hypothetical protein Btru_005189 [Bulinus truncatus]
MTDSAKLKTILQEEKKTLTKLLSMFEEQLNRLKVEEMALMTNIRMESMEVSVAVPVQEEDKLSQATRAFSDASELNKETLNLNVAAPQRKGHGSLTDFIEEIEFEEEEEEDDGGEIDSDEDDLEALKDYFY